MTYHLLLLATASIGSAQVHPDNYDMLWVPKKDYDGPEQDRGFEAVKQGPQDPKARCGALDTNLGRGDLSSSWFVQIFIRGQKNSTCGGALISAEHILTSCSCFKKLKNSKSFRLSVHDVGDKKLLNDPPVLIQLDVPDIMPVEPPDLASNSSRLKVVNHIECHTEYQADQGPSEHDIAVVTFGHNHKEYDKPTIKRLEKSQPICPPQGAFTEDFLNETLVYGTWFEYDREAQGIACHTNEYGPEKLAKCLSKCTTDPFPGEDQKLCHELHLHQLDEFQKQKVVVGEKDKGWINTTRRSILNVKGQGQKICYHNVVRKYGWCSTGHDEQHWGFCSEYCDSVTTNNSLSDSLVLREIEMELQPRTSQCYTKFRAQRDSELCVVPRYEHIVKRYDVERREGRWMFDMKNGSSPEPADLTIQTYHSGHICHELPGSPIWMKVWDDRMRMRAVLIGVRSRSSRRCATTAEPTIYTKVSRHMMWIRARTLGQLKLRYQELKDKEIKIRRQKDLEGAGGRLRAGIVLVLMNAVLNKWISSCVS